MVEEEDVVEGKRSSPFRHQLDWNVDMEVQLFYAMRGHKPVGVNRHFQMVCIHEKFKNSVQMDVTSQHIWDHLDTMYDMAALHESEIVPFPNEVVDFALPDTEFGKQIDDRLKSTPPTSSSDKPNRDADVVNIVAPGRNAKDKEPASIVADKTDVATKQSGGAAAAAHQTTGKQSSTKKSAAKEAARERASATSNSGTSTPIATSNDATADGGGGAADSVVPTKRKRNTRLQQEQQSVSKPSSPASSTSSSKGRRRN